MGIRRSPAKTNSGRAVISGVSAYEATVASGSPSTSTSTRAPDQAGSALTSTVTSPPRTAETAPAAPSRVRPEPSRPISKVPIQPGTGSVSSVPPLAVNSTVEPTESTDLTCSRRSVSCRSPATRTRAPSWSAIRTSRPSAVLAGTPENRSSQTGSLSASTVVVAPVVWSTVRYRWLRWSRACTSRVSSCSDQCTRARYGNASRSQVSSVREPSRPSSQRPTSALAVPAAG